MFFKSSLLKMISLRRPIYVEFPSRINIMRQSFELFAHVFRSQQFKWEIDQILTDGIFITSVPNLGFL